MNSHAWRARVMEYIRAEALPVDKYGHQPRLYALARAIGRDVAYDDDVVFAAAWMHDLGVFSGHRPQDPAELARWNHVPYTVARACELLRGWGFPAAKLDAVAEAIRTHQSHDEPVTVEATIMRDADILEQLGAIGIARALVKVGRDTRYPTLSAVLPVLNRALAELPAKLRLPQAQQMAVARVQTLRAFLSALEDEAGEHLH
jgi:uncharacterized protein